MNGDTREAILEQLEVLLGAVSGIQSVWRNRGDLEDIERPAAIILDGTEAIRMDQEVQVLKSRSMPAAIFTLRPQIFVVLQLRDTVTNLTLNGVADPVGPELSAWRTKMLSAVLNDPTLLGILTSNGQIVYRGCDTDMQTGSTIGALGATMQFHFEFNYVLFPPRP